MTGQGLIAILRAVHVTPGAVYGIIQHYEMCSTCEAFGQG